MSIAPAGRDDRDRPDRAPERDAPVLPERSSDEDPAGWGDEPDRADRDDWYERERPPHHG